MKTLLLGAALLALTAPAIAAGVIPNCIPYDDAIATIERSGGEVLVEGTPNFVKGKVLYFLFEERVYAAGVAGDDFCVYSPSTLVGRYVEGVL